MTDQPATPEQELQGMRQAFINNDPTKITRSLSLSSDGLLHDHLKATVSHQLHQEFDDIILNQ
jgi:hypothetical protein